MYFLPVPLDDEHRPITKNPDDSDQALEAGFVFHCINFTFLGIILLLSAPIIGIYSIVPWSILVAYFAQFTFKRWFTWDNFYRKISQKDKPPVKSQVRKRVLIDLFASKSVILPVVGGLTTLIVSWVTENPYIAFTGLGATLGGLGVFASKWVLGLEKITQQAYEEVIRKTKEQKNKILDDLEKRLKADRDPRPEKCLRELRELHLLLSQEEGIWAETILEDFERLFNVCVEQIKKTDDLWRKSRKSTGAAKKTYKKNRERLVKEIEETTLHLTKNIQQFKQQSDHQMTTSELSEAKQELERTIEVAKRVDQELSGIQNKGYDPKEFEL